MEGHHKPCERTDPGDPELWSISWLKPEEQQGGSWGLSWAPSNDELPLTAGSGAQQVAQQLVAQGLVAGTQLPPQQK